MDPKRKRKIDERVAEWITLTSQPYSVVYSQYFRNMMQEMIASNNNIYIYIKNDF